MRWRGIEVKKTWGAAVALTILVWAVVYFTAGQIGYAIGKGNNLTDFFDAYSEANGIRAGEGYADRGFAFNYGLPDVSYGNAFENIGGKHDKNLCPQLPCIYLHYPPGPDIVIGLSTKMCGKGEVSCFRTVPITFAFLALTFLAGALAWSMGVERAAFVVGSFYFAPMMTNAMHYLHNHSYVTSLLWFDVGLLLLLFVRPVRSARTERVVLAAIFVVAFLYGWCAFDVVFHVAFLPMTVWLMTGDWRAKTRTMLVATAVACAGYGLANVLHFWQVRLYLGSWSAAFEDFRARAALRTSGELEMKPQPPIRLLFTYWTHLLSEPNFLGWNFLAACGATMAPLMLRGERVVSTRWRLVWHPLPTFKWAFLASFVIPSLWLVVMRQHASVHGHFLPRNFVVTYLIGAILIALSFRRLPDPEAPTIPAVDPSPAA